MFSKACTDQGHRENTIIINTRQYCLLPYWTDASGLKIFLFTLEKDIEIKPTKQNNLMLSQKSSSILRCFHFRTTTRVSVRRPRRRFPPCLVCLRPETQTLARWCAQKCLLPRTSLSSSSSSSHPLLFLSFSFSLSLQAICTHKSAKCPLDRQTESRCLMHAYFPLIIPLLVSFTTGLHQHI